MSQLRGLPPLISPTSQVLILGSMPGAQSLAKQRYYGNPRNQFWLIMERLFDISQDWPYQVRCQRLLTKGVSVWDVIGQCRREGSLDTSIVDSSVVVNDICGLLRQGSQIKHIFFNGRKSERIFKLHISDRLESLDRNIICRSLPSTSPAHAGLSLEEKLELWRAVAECIMRSS